MPDISTPEEYNPFYKVVERLINFENTNEGKGHFSQKVLDHHGGRAIEIKELSDTDRELLNLFSLTLRQIRDILNEQSEGLTDEYRLKVFEKLRTIAGEMAGTPTQKAFRAFLNNKFAVLLGNIQIYVNSQKGMNKNGMNYAIDELQKMLDKYMPLLEGGHG